MLPIQSVWVLSLIRELIFHIPWCIAKKEKYSKKKKKLYLLQINSLKASLQQCEMGEVFAKQELPHLTFLYIYPSSVSHLALTQALQTSFHLLFHTILAFLVHLSHFKISYS